MADLASSIGISPADLPLCVETIWSDGTGYANPELACKGLVCIVKLCQLAGHSETAAASIIKANVASIGGLNELDSALVKAEIHRLYSEPTSSKLCALIKCSDLRVFCEGELCGFPQSSYAQNTCHPKSRIDENVARLEDIKTQRIRQKFKPDELEPEATGPEISDHEFATDGGNAQRLIRMHKNNIKYCHTFKKWMFWDGHRWKVDGDGSAYRFCDDVLKEIYAEAGACVDSKDRQEWAKFAIRSDSGRGYRDMLFLASFNKAIAITSDLLDVNPWLLNTQNLTIDLKTFEAREPSREDLITKTVGTDYDLTAKCPMWVKFLERTFGEDQELINYIQRAAGYSLTGSMVEQIYFFCHGTGANGKSVFLATLRALLGDYAKQASFDTFLIQHTAKVRNDLAALAGARVITASEAEEGSRLSMQVIKSWTGGDPITARFLFGEDFTFKPTGKLWLAANTKPVISERNYAAWRRVHLIPFAVTIPLEEQDRELEAKLLEELSGILIWALKGLKEYHRIGLQPPEAVKAATDAYRRENDSMAAFVSECCEIQKLAICKNSDLFSAYLDFCRMGGEEAISQKKFSEDLIGVKGIRKTRDRSLGMIWHGIQLSKKWSWSENTNPYQAQGVKDVKPNPESFTNSLHEANLSEMPSHPSQPSLDSDSKKTDPSRSGEDEGPKMSKIDRPTPEKKLKDDPGMAEFKACVQSRSRNTCRLCGQHFEIPLKIAYQGGYICERCRRDGPPPDQGKAPIT